MQRSAVPQAGTDAELSGLLARASANEQVAWDAIVERYGGLVWTIARAHGLDADGAADVSQVTWLRLAQRPGPVRQPERLGAWLATTAEQESLRVLGLRSREVPVADELGLEPCQPEATDPGMGLVTAERNAGRYRRGVGIRCGDHPGSRPVLDSAGWRTVPG